MVRGDNGPAQEAYVTLSKMDYHGFQCTSPISGEQLLSVVEDSLPRLQVLCLSQLGQSALLYFG